MYKHSRFDTDILQKRPDTASVRFPESAHTQPIYSMLLPLLLCIVNMPPIASALDMDDAARTVVLFRTICPRIEVQNGISHEVFLHPLNSTNLVKQTYVVTGSGMFVSHSNHYYVVTAKHVADGMNDSTELWTGLGFGKATNISFKTMHNRQFKGWLTNSHANVDVVVMPLTFPLDPLVFQKHFINDVLSDPKSLPSRETRLTTLGFPLASGMQLTVGDDWSPFSRDSSLSSGFQHDGYTFYLQDPSVQGYSGGPVFDLGKPISVGNNYITSQDRGLHCIGITTATLLDDTGGKMANVIGIRALLEIIQDYEQLPD